MQGFKRQKGLPKGEHGLQVGNGACVWPKVVRNLFTYFDNVTFIYLKGVFYVPSCRQNLISVSQSLRDGYTVNFHNNGTITYNGKFICCGTCHNNLYSLHPNSH